MDLASSFEAQVGAKALVELQGVGGRFNSQILGWEPGKFVILKLPANHELLQNLYVNKAIVVRYIHCGGQVRGFKSAVQGIVYAPHRVLFLSFPASIETIELRKGTRVDCTIPATLEVSDASFKALLINISNGGCKVSLGRGQDGLQLSTLVGSEVNCSFKLLESPETMRLNGVIKKMSTSNEIVRCGIQFSDPPGAVLQAIGAFVEDVVSFAGSSCTLDDI